MSKNLGDAFVRVRPNTEGFQQEADHNIGGVLKKVAAGAAAVFAASKAKEFLQEATAGYRDHLKVAAVTSQVIKTTAGAAKIAAVQVGKLADSIELKTGVDGDAIQSGANLLLTFTNIHNAAGKGNKIFSRSTGLLADMSVALGQSAKGSAIQLGKALNDPIKGVTALSKVGVSFTAQQKVQIKKLVEHGQVLKAQKVILRELGHEFGGAAAAAADPADRATVAYRQLQDQVGGGTLPVVQALQRAFADRLAPVLTRLGNAILPKISAAMVSFIDNISAGDVSKAGASFTGIADKLKSIDFGSVGSSAKDLGAAVKQLGPALAKVGTDTVSDGLSVFAVATKFAADHTDLLAKALPFLAGGFIAAKSAQALANAAQLIALPAKITDVVLTRQLTAATRQLVASRGELAAATVSSTATENISLVTRLRTTVATVASTVASKAAAAASKVWAAGQWLLNAAMTANPIGLVVVAIVALIGGLALAFAKSERFRAALGKVFSFLQGAAVKVLGFLKANWPLILAILTGPIGLVVLAIVKNWDRIRSATTTAFNAVKNAISTAISATIGFVRAHWPLMLAIITGPIGLAVLAIVKNWSRIRAATSAAWNAVKSSVASVVGSVVGLANSLRTRVVTAFNNVKSGAVNALGGLVSFVKGLPGRIIGFYAALPGRMADVGHNIVAGLIRGIKAKAGELSAALVGLLPGPLKKFAGKLGLASPSKLFAKFGRWVGEGFINGVVGTKKEIIETFSKLVDHVKKKSDSGVRKLILSTRKELSGMGDAYEKITDRVKAATDKLATIRDDAAQYASGIRDSIISSGDVGGFGGTFSSIVSGLTKARDQAQKFTDVIAGLKAAGLNNTGLGQLLAKGPDALQSAQSILSSGPGGIAQINALQGQIAKVGTKVSQIGTNALYGAGIAAAQGLVDGLKSKESALAAQMRRIAREMVNALRKEAGAKTTKKQPKKKAKKVAARLHTATRGNGKDDDRHGPRTPAGGTRVQIDVHDKSGSPRQTGTEAARQLAFAGAA